MVSKVFTIFSQKKEVKKQMSTVILLSLTAHFLRLDTVVSVCLAAESLSGTVALEIHFLDTGVYDHTFRFILCFEHKTTSLFTSSREILLEIIYFYL